MHLADAHSDLLMELVFFRGEDQPFAGRWLPKLEAGGVQLQVCALFSDDPDLPELALRKALLGVAEFDRAVAENPEPRRRALRRPTWTPRSHPAVAG